jgi:hypothetical protein
MGPINYVYFFWEILFFSIWKYKTNIWLPATPERQNLTIDLGTNRAFLHRDGQEDLWLEMTWHVVGLKWRQKSAVLPSHKGATHWRMNEWLVYWHFTNKIYLILFSSIYSCFQVAFYVVVCSEFHFFPKCHNCESSIRIF